MVMPGRTFPTRRPDLAPTDGVKMGSLEYVITIRIYVLV
jgi:hypothetical protein